MYPEIIRKQDGSIKMDCERNAIRRRLKKLRQDHPHLQFIVNEDALAANAPHIRDLREHDLRFILGVKEGDHKFLFEFVDQAVEDGQAVERVLPGKENEKSTHCFPHRLQWFLSNKGPGQDFGRSLLVRVLGRDNSPRREKALLGLFPGGHPDLSGSPGGEKWGYRKPHCGWCPGAPGGENFRTDLFYTPC